MPTCFIAPIGSRLDDLTFTKTKIIPEVYCCCLPGLDCHLLGIGAVALIQRIDRRIAMSDFLDPNRANIQSGYRDGAIVAGGMRAGNHGRTGCIGVDSELPSGKILSILSSLYDFYITLRHRQSEIAGDRICRNIHGHHGLRCEIFGIPHDHRIRSDNNFMTSGVNDAATVQLRHRRRSSLDNQGVTRLLEGQTLHRTLVIEILQNPIGVRNTCCVQAAGCVILECNGVGIRQLRTGSGGEAGDLTMILQAYQQFIVLGFDFCITFRIVPEAILQCFQEWRFFIPDRAIRANMTTTNSPNQSRRGIVSGYAGIPVIRGSICHGQ